MRVARVASLAGELRPPSDKSLSHRALMFGSIAIGRSLVRNLLGSEDVAATRQALTQLGCTFQETPNGLIIEPGQWRSPDRAIDCGNSGTSMRLLAGLIASHPIEAILTGDHSLSRRPMKRIAEPLALMGAKIEGETPPLHIHGGNLRGITYQTPVASAQIKSAILLAGLRAEGETWVSEPMPSRDHTERMLRAAGVDVLSGDLGVGVRGGSILKSFEFDVPADISSAAFWMVAAAIVPGARITLREVGVNPSRTGILDVLAQVGVHVLVEERDDELGEPVADLTVSQSGLRPFTIGGALVPRLIDEIPVLAVLATQADGVSHIRDARELRVKESDRVESVAKGLRAMGAEVETHDDGLSISGPTNLRGAEIEADGDHRIAMAFAIAGLIAQGETLINGAETIASSYPNFDRDLAKLSIV